MTSMDLIVFLQQYEPVAEDRPIWDNGRMPLLEKTYLCTEMPPEQYVTSARAILFRGDEVMVMTDFKQEVYIVPGGRRDPGESVEGALHREVLEETGWTIKHTAVLGVVHFHHLGSKPSGYRYAYPDFLQVIYTAEAGTFHPESIQPDPYVSESGFRSMREAQNLALTPGQRALLAAAMMRYRKVNGDYDENNRQVFTNL